MTVHDNFWVLFAKNLSGETTPEEQALLQEMIQQHPEWQQALQNAEYFWKNKSAATSADSLTAEDAYMLHMHRMSDLNIDLDGFEANVNQGTVKRMPARRWYWVAASVLVVVSFLGISAGFFSRKKSIQPLAEKNEVSTKPGSKSTIKLPDGSVVTLNAGSKLTYNKDFGKELREVTLSGEGYFDVAKMKEKPFIIHTSNIKIKVLGTVFNVKAYPEDKQTETSLIHGSIEVTIRNRPEDKIILSPNEKLVVENDRAKPSAKPEGNGEAQAAAPPFVHVNKIYYNPSDSTVAETAWLNNKLVFRDEAFEDLALRLERKYDVIIKIDNEGMKSERVNGTFETETIGQALQALQEMVHFKFEKNGNKIVIQ